MLEFCSLKYLFRMTMSVLVFGPLWTPVLSTIPCPGHMKEFELSFTALVCIHPHSVRRSVDSGMLSAEWTLADLSHLFEEPTLKLLSMRLSSQCLLQCQPHCFYNWALNTLLRSHTCFSWLELFLSPSRSVFVIWVMLISLSFSDVTVVCGTR